MEKWDERKFQDMKKIASDMLYCELTTLKHFEVEDSFNEGNILEGFITMKASFQYGSMAILRINGVPTAQRIYATPKLHYPREDKGTTFWPKDVGDVRAFSKLDGTNVLSYHYNWDGIEFTTFKTRLCPVIRNTTFGPFLDMWREMLKENPWIETNVHCNPCYNLSFEMFGSRNPITVKYDNTLDVALLFGVDVKEHCVISPHLLTTVPSTKIPEHFELNQHKDLNLYYSEMRSRATKENKDSEGNNVDEWLAEGYVFYVRHDPRGMVEYEMVKCKAEQIETIHRLASRGIPKAALWTTAVNCFESFDAPTLENFKTLLEEEYSCNLIERSLERIVKILIEVKSHMQFCTKINMAWKLSKEAGLDVTKDKAETMRFLSNHFEKKEMSKVGTHILRQAGLI